MDLGGRTRIEFAGFRGMAASRSMVAFRPKVRLPSPNKTIFDGTMPPARGGAEKEEGSEPLAGPMAEV